MLRYTPLRNDIEYVTTHQCRFRLLCYVIRQSAHGDNNVTVALFTRVDMLISCVDAYTRDR